MTRSLLIGGLLAWCWSAPTSASFSLHESFSQWAAAAGGFETITFAELPVDTLVLDQYASLGVTFVDFDGNWTNGTSLVTYPQDGVGLDGEEIIDIHLTRQALAVGAHFPGILRYRLYSAAVLIFDSDLMGPLPYDNFGGVVSSTVSFDRILMSGQLFADQVFLDNLYIAFAPVPAPAGLAVVLLAPLLGRTRSRPRGD